jgi:asparagine synthase (glutamine-hydrolysing)
MARPLLHRGPDDAGTWVNQAGTLAFGFRRLSEEGHQPMSSASGRFVMVFNGEIYNHAELRSELTRLGHHFRGHSDSEVLLASFDQWGVEPSLQRCVGMFAIAVWDEADQALHLVRDRLGIKPLFVATGAGAVLFASELKGLLADPRVSRRVNPDSLASFFRYLYVPGPRSIFEGVMKLRAGHLLTLRRPGDPLPESRPFWSLSDVARHGLASPFEGSDEDAVDVTEECLVQAVRQRMYADVPLGALLSGGIDSSLVVALMQRAAGSAPVKTYSVAFEEEEYDEAAHAAEVANYLGTQHTEVTLTHDEAWNVVPRLPEMFDEPFASPSAIPNFLICQVARRDVTVALSGTGGDEVFAGYNRYLTGERLINLAARIPRPVRRLVGGAVHRVPYGRWSTWRRFSDRLPLGPGIRQPGRQAFKLARLMASDSRAAMYRSLVSAWDRPDEVVTTGRERGGSLDEALAELGADGDLLHGMLLVDQQSYLVDDQLAKVDRVSMAVSLELRVPLLDHRLIELAWRLPARMKRRRGEGKWVLRRVLERQLPNRLFERPKMGLSVPIEVWLRGPLREWASDTLADLDRGEESLVRASAVQDVWCRFLAGEHGLDLAIWAALMYGAWRGRWIG